METIVTLCPEGTLTGKLPVLLLGLRATAWPDTVTWVVIGLKTPAGFCVTMVLVTAVDPVGERAGLAVVTRGPVGLKLTAAMGTRAAPCTLDCAGCWLVCIRRMLGARSVTGVTPLRMGVAGLLGAGWARMGREVRLAGTTVTLLEGIMVRLGLTLLLTVLLTGRMAELAPPPTTGLLVVTKVGLWLVGTVGILKIFPSLHSLLSTLSKVVLASPDLSHGHVGSLRCQVYGGNLSGGRRLRTVCRIVF